MDQSNYENVIALAETQQEIDKVEMILGADKEVPDPYYGGSEGFQYCYDLLDHACNRIQKSIG